VSGIKQPRDPPPPGVTRWTPQRKLDVVKAIEDGRLNREIAINAYGLSEEELASWERLADIGSIPQHRYKALRTTRLQIYRTRK
jgi:hypothetical protein